MSHHFLYRYSYNAIVQQILWAVKGIAIMSGVLMMSLQAANAEDAASIVGGAKSSAISGITSPESVKAVQDIINYQRTDIPEVNLKNTDMSDAARVKAESSEEAKIVKDAFVAQGKASISKDDKMFKNSEAVIKNPERYVDWISGKYEDCDGKLGGEVFDKEEQVCDEFHHAQYSGASDSGYNYQCVKQRESIRSSCEKSLIVKFEEYEEGCKAIEFSGLNKRDSRVSVGENEAVVNHVFPLKKRGNEKEYRMHNDVSVKFVVNDIKAVQDLYIDTLEFGSMMHVDLNGRKVLDHQVRGRINDNIDLKPHIKEGVNRLSFRTELHYDRIQSLT
ncbi:MAG: hypothetical protein ACK5V4_01360, partial [Alphaproteobacteria bacterium]